MSSLAAEWKAGAGRLVLHIKGVRSVELEGADATVVPSRRCEVCHPWRRLQALKRLGTVEFDHLSHASVDCVVCHTRTAHPGTAGVAVDPPATMLACFACHVGREGPENCLFCHAPKHPDRGRCQDCHGLTGWRSGLLFHHEPTLGKGHAKVSCESCHNHGFGRRAAARPCAACHQPAHGGVTDCAACHRLRAWLPPTYRHPHVASHVGPGWARFSCDSCHPGGAFSVASCGCHTPPPGHQRLTGGHRWFVCSSCHAGGTGGAAAGCARCHAAPHRRPLDCARCHGLASWSAPGFVHPAAGPHVSGSRRLPCRACHTSGYGRATCSCHGSPPGSAVLPRLI